MPSDKGKGRLRKLRRRGVRRGTEKQEDSEANDPVESQPPKEQPKNMSPVVESNIAALRHPEKRPPTRRQRAARRQSELRTWAFRVFLVLILFIWGLLLLSCFKFGLTESVSPTEVTPGEVNGQSLKKTLMEILYKFFFPTTCTVKENQEVKACNGLLNPTELECLTSKCCFSPGTGTCFIPLINKPVQMIRLFGLCMSSLLLLGSLPICCCCLWQRSKYANSLRMKNERILEGVKKEREKLKGGTEVSATTTEEEDGNEDEKESEALLSR
ncbi:PREDICTED: fragile X mental retardation 1 neighbor protein [Chinchilla lanigera]|uniref:fragile X mental retardation 1 neighbor protein n=1 Tax=Chinchilla lanigera TaxID=34839 RepID=UPI00038E967C|nr:PREDICTED: fragile X mental retardation 1 neighbor protein [Chinchilla lanigera]